MGMDISGINPKNTNGEYFRNNVWWWRPLWNYVYLHCGKIITEKEFNGGHYNDGQFISDKKAEKIANKLIAIRSITKQYAKQFKTETKPKIKFNSLINEAAQLYYDKIVDKQNGKITCPGDLEKLNPKAYKIWSTLTFDLEFDEPKYPFSEQNVEEFITFIKSSGGFEIY